MTSRLTLSALLFSILSTSALVWTAEADATVATAVPTATMRVVQLERVVIAVPRKA